MGHQKHKKLLAYYRKKNEMNYEIRNEERVVAQNPQLTASRHRGRRGDPIHIGF